MPATISIAQMRTRAIFQKNEPQNTDSGGQVDNWIDLVTTIGYFKKRSGFRTLENGFIGLASTWEYICRFEKKLEDLGSNIHVIIKGDKYTIDSIEYIDEKRFYIKFTLKTLE